MNWGGFAGGLAQGINNGLSIGSKINDVLKEQKINSIREQGMKEAEQARADSVAGMIRENGIGAAPTQPQRAVEPAAATGQMAPDNVVAQTAPVQAPVVQDIPAGGQVPPAPPAQPAAMGMAGMPSAPAANAPSPAAGGINAPAAPPSPKPFMVGDMGFDTKEEATKHAQKNAPSVMEFFIKQAVPKIQQGYLEQGDPAKAEAWGRYAEGETSRQNMDTWSKAYRSAQAGDMEGAAKHVFKLYQNYDDGITPVSHETVKDKDGNVTGFNVKLKTDASGEVRSQFVGKNELVEMGLSALSPPALFEQEYKRKNAAEAARLAAAGAELKDARALGRDLVKENTKAVNTNIITDKKIAADKEKATLAGEQRLKEIDLQQTLRNAGLGKAKKAEIEAKVEALRGAGYEDESINSMMPALLGTGEYKKTTDPTERRALIATELMKSDPSFARADSAKQADKVDQMMNTIYGAKPTKGATANPFEAGAKPAGNAGAKKTGVPVFDPVSKSIVYR